jgi:hypothetical protein
MSVRKRKVDGRLAQVQRQIESELHDTNLDSFLDEEPATQDELLASVQENAEAHMQDSTIQQGRHPKPADGSGGRNVPVIQSLKFAVALPPSQEVDPAPQADHQGTLRSLLRRTRKMETGMNMNRRRCPSHITPARQGTRDGWRQSEIR